MKVRKLAMRIGYLVPEFPGQTHIFFWRELKVLRQLGADLRLLSTRRPEQLSRHSFGKEAMAETCYLFPPRWATAFVYLLCRPLLTLRMIRYVVRVEATPWSRKLRLLGLMLCAAELLAVAARENIGHVHGHSCADVAHLLALAAESGRLDFSLTLHGDLPVYGTGHGAKFRAAKFVACVTYALQKQVIDTYAIPVARLPVIRMGVDIDKFQPGLPPEAKSGRLHLITVARLAECKGHVYALRAIRQAIDQGLEVRYTIVGEGEHRTALEQEIARLGLHDQVTLVGTAGEHEVLKYLHQAECFILPSVGLGEAAPVSVMEAMACHLPSIASIIGGTPEMIQPMINGILVVQADVQGLADAILLLGRDPALRQRLADEARKTAVEQFSALHFASQLYQFITQGNRRVKANEAR